MSGLEAQMSAISILTCIAADRRGEPQNIRAAEDMTRALVRLNDDDAGELMERLSRALDILEGRNP